MTQPSDSRTPVPALLLGLGGLIPFIGGALLQVFTQDPRWLSALAGYGAVILSFVGAVHWGFAVRDAATGAAAWWRFGWSVVPALIGWICLLLEPAAGVLGLAGALVLCLLVDEAFARNDSLPAWLMPLRRLLTAGSATSLLAAGLLS